METVKQFRLLVGNMPMVYEVGGKEIEYRFGKGRRVVVRHPIKSLRSLKLFLYCLWQVEELVRIGFIRGYARLKDGR